jgi:YHS domain-containing protein
MEGLGSLLLFAVLFFLMMRFGCGAHLGGQRHGHGKAPPAPEHQDPVCQRPVPPTEGYGLMHGGALYRFCSRECLDRFEADPGRYTPKTMEGPS